MVWGGVVWGAGGGGSCGFAWRGTKRPERPDGLTEKEDEKAAQNWSRPS